ncbi:MAG: DUF1918 domain-containing protein [Actinobacteria bacterium]|nr:DUF1918 domain-containing protein [Actinomycetota bacterium]
MEAGIGDRVAVVFSDDKQHQREARIIDIRDAAGSETYLVEWTDNGHRQLVSLGTGSHMEQRS